jgi:hypothetical protein
MADCYLELTQGQWAVVDDEDYEELSKHKWYAHWSNGAYYARRVIRVNGKRKFIHMHRELLSITCNSDLEGDHIDGDTLNNKRNNLRAVTHKQNTENINPSTIKSSTGVRGVSFNRNIGRYIAYVYHNYKMIHLGYFSTLEEATKAAEAGRAKYYTPIKSGI